MKKILVSGASSGLGRALGRLLRDRGYYVIATGRNPDQVSRMVGEGLCDAALIVDLGSHATVQSIPRQLEELGIESLDGVIHCAAVISAAPLETVAMDEARHIIEVNVFGTLGLIQSTADFLRRGRGRLILTGSIAGFSVWPMLSVYGASKHALEALADSARRELRPWDIKVSLVRPGGIRSRMLGEHLQQLRAQITGLDGVERERYGALYRHYTQTLTRGAGFALEPEVMAAKLIRVLESGRPKPSYCFGAETKVLRAIDLLLPDSVFDFLVRRLFPTR